MGPGFYGYGISFLNSSKNVIGSDEVGGGNVISGNGEGGIIIDELPVDGFYSDDNRILGNKIGLTDDGLTLGNGGAGIWVASGGRNSIGDFGNPFGRAFTSANIIAYNHSGVVITAESRPGTPIVGNFIYNNEP